MNNFHHNSKELLDILLAFYRLSNDDVNKVVYHQDGQSKFLWVIFGC